MAQHRVLEQRAEFLILLELEKLDRDSLPLHLRTLMDTRTYLECPPPGASVATLRTFWSRLKDALGTALALSGTREEQHQECSEETDDDYDFTFCVGNDQSKLIDESD